MQALVRGSSGLGVGLEPEKLQVEVRIRVDSAAELDIVRQTRSGIVGAVIGQIETAVNDPVISERRSVAV